MCALNYLSKSGHWYHLVLGSQAMEEDLSGVYCKIGMPSTLAIDIQYIPRNIDIVCTLLCFGLFGSSQCLLYPWVTCLTQSCDGRDCNPQDSGPQLVASDWSARVTRPHGAAWQVIIGIIFVSISPGSRQNIYVSHTICTWFSCALFLLWVWVLVNSCDIFTHISS